MNAGTPLKAHRVLPGWTLALCASAILLACAHRSALAQSNYFEGFDDNGPVNSGDVGPSNLIANGWIFRQQSDPPGPFVWSDDLLQDPQAGASDLGDSVWSVDGSGVISDWAILPPVPGQQAGDILSLYWSASQSRADRLQIRYSPTGATGTGTGPQDVGDFTEVLLDTFPVTNFGWIPLSVEVPGPGRIAIRRYLDPGGLDTGFGTYVRIDSLSVATPVAPPPPMDITWPAADNPHVISGTFVIAADEVVTAEPGVVIQVDPGSTLQIEGGFVGHGTPADPIVISGDVSLFTPAVRVLAGSMDLAFSQLDCSIIAQAGASLLVADSAVTAGLISGKRGIADVPYLQIDRCAFTESSAIQTDGAMLALRDSSFAAASPPDPFFSSLSLYRCYVYLDNVTLDGMSVTLVRERSPQTLYVDNVSVSNNPTAAALDLTGGNFFFGPGVVLQNNLYTAQMWSAGILPGSTLPPTGNTNNYLLNDGDGDRGGNLIWGDPGIPYVVTGVYSQRGGSILFTDGTTVRLGPGAAMFADPATLRARGTPGNPVTFERFDPSQQWQGLQFFQRFENCVIDGGQIGARFHSASEGGEIDNCIIRNCDFGIQNNVIARKTRLLNNATGAWNSTFPTDGLSGAEGANSFVGDTLAIDSNGGIIDARHNWWGDPSGPSAPDNPGGTGDTVLGVGVTTVPFLTQPPDFANNPPIVHLNAPAFTAQVGDRFMLTWNTTDDGAIASHRVLFKGRSGEPFQLIADNIPGNQNTLEITVPDINQTNLNGPAFFRVESIDDAGQIGWDDAAISVPWPTGDTTEIIFTSDFTGPFTAGQNIPVCWSGPMATGYLLLDNDGTSMALGGSNTGCLAIGVDLPYVSTDCARVVLVYQIATNQYKYFFSEPFAIRPDTRLGDAPPTVQMTSPQAGQSHSSGATVPIAWTASDDEALRSLSIQASYDAGRTWHVIADDLAPTATSYDWFVPASQGYADVRVRVIANDLRFQNSSNGADQAFAITPPALCTADIDSSGTTDVLDFAILASNFGSKNLAPFTGGDLDGDSDDDVFDFTILATDFGCAP